MGVFLSHVDMTPVFYGIILAVWFIIIMSHLRSGNILAVLIDVGAFTLVFWMHNGTMTGGMAATVCGLIVSLVVPPMFRR